jgi:hypothetical protein
MFKPNDELRLIEYRKVDIVSATMKIEAMNTKLSLFAVVATVGFALGCSSPEGVKYVDPGAQGKVAGTGIESQDIGAAAVKAAQSIVNLPQITQATEPPIILITPVTNRSATPIDADLYTVKLRGTLMQYGGGKVRFLARDVSWNVNKEEMAARAAGEVQQGAARNAHTFHYILTAELRGISASSSQGRSEYFLVAFKLVDINDLLLWENQYEIKKEGSDNAVYR